MWGWHLVLPRRHLLVFPDLVLKSTRKRVSGFAGTPLEVAQVHSCVWQVDLQVHELMFVPIDDESPVAKSTHPKQWQTRVSTGKVDDTVIELQAVAVWPIELISFALLILKEPQVCLKYQFPVADLVLCQPVTQAVLSVGVRPDR